MFFKRAWRGEEPLWKVFWLYGAGGMFVPFILVLLGSVNILHRDDKLWLLIPSIGIIFLFILYLSVWCTLLEKCRFNTQFIFWRFATLFYYIVPCAYITLLGFIGYSVLAINLYKLPNEDYICENCINSPDSGCIERVFACALTLGTPMQQANKLYWEHP